jgi:hypothetical protein
MKKAMALYIRIQKRNTFSGLYAGLGLIILAFFLGCATTDATKLSGPALQPAAQNMEEAGGIKVKSLRLTAGGNMIDLRYQVTDPAKASSLLNNKTNKPCLVDLTSGALLTVPNMPKIGAMRSSTKNLVTGKDYFILFSNPGLKHGSEVALVIGDLKMEHLTIE